MEKIHTMVIAYVLSFLQVHTARADDMTGLEHIHWAD